MKLRLVTTTLALSIITAATAQADCKGDIEAILQAMQTAPPYQVEIETTSDGSTIKMQGKAILPESIQMKGDGMEMVLTPNGFWMGKDGQLKKSPPEAAEQMRTMMKQGMNLGMQAIEAPECPGSVSYEGADFQLYKYIAKGDFMGIKSTSNVDMYVNSSGYSEWMIIDGEAMGIKSLTRQHITYDDSVKIADPK